MPGDTTWYEARTQQLASYLIDASVLDPADRDSRIWLDALREVPRHLFIPPRAWAEPQDDRPSQLIDRGADPDAWWDAVYSNCAIITQRGDGGADVADRRAHLTSSNSSPHVVMEFLRLLELDSHQRVLEVGTGTGWTAAMLAWRLGDDQVATIEVDEAVAAVAAENLKAAGMAPATLVGGGELGVPERAPFDRVHVTCGVRHVPYEWVEQTRPGGSIVMPYMLPHGQWGEQLRLDVLDDGTAVGSFHGGCGFMMLRSQRRDSWPPYSEDGVEGTTRVDPRAAWAALNQGFGLNLAAAAPHIAISTAGWEQQDDDWTWVMRLRDLRGDGWAIATFRPGEETHVVQSGDRQLWTALEAAFMEWLRAGRPGRGEYRMIVTPGGQDVWLP
ncbi:protein-L-isoaspartate O-methyltransferase family protein [Nonomuraea sp. 10N515B]|uniref:protein-L-isoaspartate O-methyltransferase family protein n=1 Tax=Nonomuraea sp. 10N515B TaxID=3457422 RepID=UPI003FCC9508